MPKIITDQHENKLSFSPSQAVYIDHLVKTRNDLVEALARTVNPIKKASELLALVSQETISNHLAELDKDNRELLKLYSEDLIEKARVILEEYYESILEKKGRLPLSVIIAEAKNVLRKWDDNLFLVMHRLDKSEWEKIANQ